MAADLSDRGEVGREVRLALGRPPSADANLADLDDAAAAELRQLVSAVLAKHDHESTFELAQLSVALALLRNDSTEVARLVATAEQAAEELGGYDAFAATLRDLLRAAIERLRAGNIEGLKALRSATLALAGAETARARYDAASQLISELQDYCDRLGDRYGRFLCLVHLAENAYIAKDVDGMRDCALALSQAEAALPGIDDDVRQHVSAVLFNSAAHVYAAGEYQVAKRLLERAMTIRPDDGELHLWLGHCEQKLGFDDAALAQYERAARLKPDFASIHLSLSGLALRQKDFDRTLVACDRAIALRPDDARGHWIRAAALIGKERHGEAIVALKRVIELGEAAACGNASGLSDAGVTLPSADGPINLASVAHSLLLDCYVEAGDLAQAEAHAHFLSVHATDPNTKAAANEHLARKQDTDYLTAVVHLTQAIAQAPTLQHHRCERADLYLRHGTVDKALDDFETLLKAGPSEQTARFVAERLDRILAEHPANAQARKLLAFMLHKVGHNRPAEQELSRAIELDPDQAELYYLRGICRIGTSLDKGKPTTPSEESVTAGALDLARAVKLSNNKPMMVDALLWVIDHTAPDRRVFSFWFNAFLQQLRGHENIFLLVPELLDPFLKIHKGIEHTSRDEWQAAVDVFRSAQEPLRRLGLTFLASSLDVYIADALVGIDQYREAEDCLRGFDPLRWSRPLSPDLQHHARRARTAIQIGAESPLEQEYLHVQAWTVPRLLLFARLIRAGLFNRTNRIKQALAELGPIDKLLDSIDSYLTRDDAIAARLKVIPILRDGGEQDRALGLLETWRRQNWPRHATARCLDLTGTIHQLNGDDKAALGAFTAGLKRVSDDPALHAHLLTRIAAAQVALNDPGKALVTLQSVDAAICEQNSGVALNYRMAKFRALTATGRLQEGLDCLHALLQWADHIRGTLPSLDWRRDFQARFVDLYAEAIAAYATADDGLKAFELCEQSKARSFADQLLLTGSAELAEATAPREAIAKLKEQLHLLGRIAGAAAGEGDPYELLVRLRALDPDVQLLEADGTDALRLSRERVLERRGLVANRIGELQDEVERLRLAAVATTAGPALDYPAVRSLIGAASPPQRRIVLLEYFVAGDFIFLFVGRNDLERPLIRRIECSSQALAKVVTPKVKRWSARHRHQLGEPKEIELEPFFLQFLAPVLEGGSEALAAPGDLLWIVPHDLLHYVPFHAVAFEGQLLIDRNPICYAPSSSVMKFCLERHTGRLDSALVVGDTRGHVEEFTRVVGTVPVALLEPDPARGGATVWNDGPQPIHIGVSRAETTTASRPLGPQSGFRIDRMSESGFRRDGLWAVAKTDGQRVRMLDEDMLVQARAEACRIAELFQTAPLLDKAATKTRITHQFATARYDVVHFACHAEYDARKPLDSAIWLAGDPLPGGEDPRPALLTARDFLDLRVEAQLVVLSACQTGLSDLAEGDEMTGLPRSLLASGASSLVASLWPVDDISTVLLMARFYHNLLAAEPSAPAAFRKAVALQQAQSYLRKLTVADAAALCREQIAAAQGLPDAEARIRPYEDMLNDLASFAPSAPRFSAYHFWAPFSLVGSWN